MLAAAGIERPRLEARLLLAHAAGLDQAALLRDLHTPVPAPSFDALVARRAMREPLAYLTGRREFWSLSFATAPDTLIPRPDSEAVVEAALRAAPRPRRVLDLGTGTGCLLLAVLHERPGAWGLGVDLRPGAAMLAASNARALGLADRAAFLCADWGAPLGGEFDLVVCNPPYIPSAEVGGLMPDVALFEPRSALDGGADGLAAYRRVMRELPGLLTPDGVAVLELGAGQAQPVAGLAGAAGFVVVAAEPDMGGTPRALVLRQGPTTRMEAGNPFIAT